MRLPSVAITAAFAWGVAMGLSQPVARLATSRAWLAAGFLASCFLIVIAIAFLNWSRFNAATIVSGLSWILLGTLGGWISEQPLPDNHITSLIEPAALICTRHYAGTEY